MSADRNIDYWDRVAGEASFGHPLEVDRLLAVTGPDARLLDLGCGYGRLSRLLAEAGFGRVVGVDAALGMANRARQTGLLAVVAKGRALPFSDDAFDAALLFAVLTCVPEDAEQRALVAEIERVVRPGGALYVSDYLVQRDARNRARYARWAAAGGAPWTFELDGIVFRHHEPGWIDELLADFETVERREVEVTTMHGHRARGFQWIGRRPAGERVT